MHHAATLGGDEGVLVSQRNELAIDRNRVATTGKVIQVDDNFGPPELLRRRTERECPRSLTTWSLKTPHTFLFSILTDIDEPQRLATEDEELVA